MKYPDSPWFHATTGEWAVVKLKYTQKTSAGQVATFNQLLDSEGAEYDRLSLQAWPREM